MLRDWLPGFCSRLRIFLSYSSEHRLLAEKIAQTLKNSGHRVFFDKDSLPPAGDYNERIRKAIQGSDRFLFLASRSALEPGKYTLTELDFAQKRWPSPVGRVFPVIIDPQLRVSALPTYLGSVQALTIGGNAPAEIAATIERTGSMAGICWACLGLSTLALAAVAGLVTGILPTPYVSRADVVLIAPEYVHFRPRQRPPDDPSATGADTGWANSPVTVTLPIAYSSRNSRSAPAQVIREDVELQLGDRKESYVSAHIVQLSGTSVAQSTCGTDWLCVKANAKVETLAPGSAMEHELMFLPLPGRPLTWGELVDAILESRTATASVSLTARVDSADGSSRNERVLSATCQIDANGLRQRLTAAGFRAGQAPRPPWLQPRCVKST